MIPTARRAPEPVAHDTLLSPGDPAPVVELRPGGASPFLLIADHAGQAVPARLGDLGLPRSELDRHIGWDIGIYQVIEAEGEDAAALAASNIWRRGRLKLCMLYLVFAGRGHDHAPAKLSNACRSTYQPTLGFALP